MLTFFLLAGLLTLALAMVLLAFFAGGVVFCFIPRLRFLAPFVLFIPTLTAMGAGVGSWGCGHLAVTHGGGMSALPLWAWLLGLAAGGLIGFLVGLGLALVTRKRFAAAGKKVGL